MSTRVLYIFVDEGGDLVFSSSGTKFFTLTAMTLLRPFVIQQSILNLKYDLWERGFEFEYFHATNDKYETRKEVFRIISKNLCHFSIDSIVVEKRKTNPKLYDKKIFYIKVFELLFNYVLKRKIGNVSNVFIITDKIPIERRKKEIEGAIKLYISKWSRKLGIPYKIFHYSSKSDINLQIVDYINWAIFRKWERNDYSSYDMIKSAVLSEFDVFKIGNVIYY